MKKSKHKSLLLEEPNEVAENNDNAQPGAAVLPQLADGYNLLVQVANDSDYESDYNSDDEDEN